ncbi:sensor histidine kinase [Peptoniphilus sp.]|uniref:sensor histidine kinase n=1 Tax=Peptoniphilus sp. TaxID=1971214 RepID=UPI0039957D79
MIYLIAILLLISIYFNYKLIAERKRFKKDFNIRTKINSTSKMKSDYGVELNEVANRLEELLMKNKDQRVQIRNLDDFHRENLADMSHDLRTPLTSIIGYIKLLEKENLNEKERSYLDIIKNKSLYLKNMIDMFYEASLAEMGSHLNMEIIDVLPIINECVLTYYDDFDKKFDSTEVDLDGKLEIEVDENIFRQVASNILSNMLKYSLGQNKIKYSDGKLYFKNLTDLEDGNYNKLFEKSFVLDSSRQNSSGLGLYIVKTRLDSMNICSKIYVQEKIFTIEIDFKKLL